MLGVRRGGVHGQTGDAHLTMTGWVGSKEGKRGRVGGKGDGRRGVCVWGGGATWLCFCRGHTKNRNGMVNLAQWRNREKNRNELMSMLFLSLYMLPLLCDLLQHVSVRICEVLTRHLHSNNALKR